MAGLERRARKRGVGAVRDDDEGEVRDKWVRMM